MVAGNQPLVTKTAPLYIYGEIESGNRHGALVRLGGPAGDLAPDPGRAQLGPAPVGNRAWPLIAWSRVPDAGRRAASPRRSLAIGRRLLIAAVLGWFALLILVPSLALFRQVYRGRFAAVSRVADHARGAPRVRSVAGHHGARDARQHGLRGGVCAGAGPAAILGAGDPGRRRRPAVRRLADRRRLDADRAVRARRAGWAAGSSQAGFRVVYAIPGMIIATLFVTVPFVVRELVPILRELGEEHEQAAYTLGAGRWRTFWSVTLPSIRWGVAYGVTLTVARSLGEFGAVLVVSGNLIGKTQTATLFVHDGIETFHTEGAYAASLVLAAVSFVLLVGMDAIRKRLDAREGRRP